MASSSVTLSLCSLASHCKITCHGQNSSLALLSKPSISLPTKLRPLCGHHVPVFSHLVCSTRRALLLIPKSSEPEAPAAEPEQPPESEASVVESAPETSSTETVEAAEVAKEKPKREEIFAVVMVGGRQYIVFPGRYIYTQRLKGANVNDKVTLNKVLLVGTKTSTYIGKPVVTNAAVHAVVEEQGLNKKVVVFKYKKKKKYRRNIGHRQPNTRIRITGITGYEDYPATANVPVEA